MKKFLKNIGNINKSGFTLVELLIVITILAILSVAVLSTLNPIEQANKATDSRYKNDAAEVLSAFERYYASKQEYPWMDTSFTDEKTSATTLVGLLAGSAGAGICGNAAAGSILTDNGTSCSTEGILITSDELKTTFRNKSFITTEKVTDKVYVWKTQGSAIYVCYIPRAKTNRTASTNNPLYSLAFDANGLPSADPVKKILNSAGSGAGDATHCPGLASTEWDAVATSCFVCVP